MSKHATYAAPSAAPEPAPGSIRPPKHTVAAPREGCECDGCEAARRPAWRRPRRSPRAATSAAEALQEVAS